jgi:hypothetical protein
MPTKPLISPPGADRFQVELYFGRLNTAHFDKLNAAHFDKLNTAHPF